jgi:WD40 repeat protein/serine/threonine protein kinase
MPSLFISYRRSDSPDTVKLIHERLKRRLPRWDIFYDHESIPLGEQFPERLRAKVTTATVVMVIIGPKWLEILHERKSAAIDHVRAEVRLALEANSSVVPILVGRAAMPAVADLADFADLQPLLTRNGCPVRPDPDFDGDLEPIVAHLKQFDSEETIGATLADKYTLTAEIGHGGMGVVYRAEQKQPVKRTVAVKLIKPGMDSRDVLARFDAERQALAVMDHPNIAKVLDAGLAASGRPFFVMEHVRGVPITQYCDDKKLTPQERLSLFIPVCNAVQHAHQKGIIHRDLKPSNVLVEIVDGRPIPKVIDFGLAKALGQKLTDKTLYTAVDTRIGTLEYSAPEQAAGRSFDVDTRSDIYSLGILLYELLTGAPPFTHEELLRVGDEEMRRVIREDEPSKPSKKLSSSGEVPAIAANRHLEPAKLTRLVQGDLDWIVMKCLEKEQDRRYETANQLGQELQRFLADEPVQAGPPSAGYRMRKFLRRNKGPVFAAALVLMALVAGVIGTSIGLVIAVQAREGEAEQRQVAEANEAKAQKETKRAEDEKKLADIAKRAAEENERTAEWRLYASQINSAQREWETSNVHLAYHYLNSCRQDFRGWEYDYLYTLFNKNQQTIRGHAEWVLIVAFSPDGKKIVSGSWDKTLKLWDASNGIEILSLKGHKGAVDCVAFSPDGKEIVSGSDDGTLKVWDASSGQETLTLEGHKAQVSSVAFSADGKKIVSGSWDGMLKVWDASSGQVIKTLKGHDGWVTSVAFSPDGKKIVSACTDKTLKVWDASSGQETLTLERHTRSVQSVAFSPDGKKIVSGSADKTLKLWDASNNQEILTLKGHTEEVISVAFSPDGKEIVSGGDDGTLRVWDASSGQETSTLKGHAYAVTSVAYSPDGKRIVSGSADKTLKLWNASKAPDALTLKGYTGIVHSVAFSPDGNKVVIGSWPGTKVWDASSGQEILALKVEPHQVISVAFSQDGKKIVSGSMDQTLKVWDASSGIKTLSLKGHTDTVESVAFSPDGRMIVSGSRDGTLKVWDASNGQEILTLKGHTDRVESVAFSTDGKKIFSGSWDGTLKVWDASSGQEILSLKRRNDWAGSLAFGPDGKKIVSGSRDKTLKVWDASSGQEILTSRGILTVLRAWPSARTAG